MNHLPLPSRKTRLAAAFTLALSSMTSAFALDLAQTPLFIPTPLDPNLVVTLDDSGSMAWAYVPDNIGDKSSTRRFKSASFNPLYYNPLTNYLPAVDENGNSLPSCGNPSTPKTCMQTTYINGLNAAKGTIDLLDRYTPTVSYVPSSTTQTTAANLADDFTDDTDLDDGVLAYYYQYTGADGCTTSDDSCYERTYISEDKYLNFSTWYAFYRTRNLMTVTGASRAFAGLGDNIRIAWQSLNTCNSLGTNCNTATGTANNGIRKFTGDHRSNFFSWLSRLPANSGTPLRSAFGRAGTYYTTSGVNSPYAENPRVTVGTEYSCRPNFHIAMTDGIWNGSFSSSIDDDEDSKTLPDGKTYDPNAALSRIFKSTSSGNVADIAFHYWANDLRGNLDNDLPPYMPYKGNDTANEQYWNPRNDPATWQHMVNFTVGLGLSGSLGTNWQGDTFAGSFIQDLNSGSQNWPATGANNNPGNVYDLWHAAINSRGQFFSADDPQGLADAFEKALNRVMEKSSSAAALAANSTRLGTGTAVFQARFDSSSWSGDLFAIPLNPDGSTSTTAWNAAANIPAHNKRNIVTWNPESGGATFTEAGLTDTQETALLDGRPAEQLDELLAFLRGDGSNEQPSGLGFRKRVRAISVSSPNDTGQSPLGDIINSDPAFVSTENFGYSTLPEGAALGDSPYDTFRTGKNERRRVVYVGANDGMLHAFDAGSSVANNPAGLIGTGEELFAYIPNAVIPNLAELADPNYAHRYYVDGAPFAGDAFVNGSWKTMLVGSVGAGGKAIYALDVTDPQSFVANNVHWEFSHTELGNSMGKPAIARLATGKWVAVFGNGPNSTSKDPKLFMVDLTKNANSSWSLGTNFWILNGTKADVSPNYDEALDYGLSEPTLYDIEGDRVVDYIYAGDIQGNVWKFDVTSASGTYQSGRLLFTARNSAGQNQPITSPIEIGSPPPSKSGVMLYFGTGRFFANGDNLDTENSKIQSFYGIHDAFLNNPPVISRSGNDLVAQTIIFQGSDATTGHDQNEIRLISTNAVSYNSKKGWYLDLAYNNTAIGERVVSAPLLRYGRVIFTTLIPSTDPCDFGGDGWLMELDAISGSRLAYSVFDLDSNKLFNDSDMVSHNRNPTPVSGVKSKVGIVKTPAVISAGEIEYKVMSGTTGEIQVVSEKGGNMTGRTSWREIFTR